MHHGDDLSEHRAREERVKFVSLGLKVQQKLGTFDSKNTLSINLQNLPISKSGNLLQIRFEIIRKYNQCNSNNKIKKIKSSIYLRNCAEA